MPFQCHAGPLEDLSPSPIHQYESSWVSTPPPLNILPSLLLFLLFLNCKKNLKKMNCKCMSCFKPLIGAFSGDLPIFILLLFTFVDQNYSLTQSSMNCHKLKALTWFSWNTLTLHSCQNPSKIITEGLLFSA